MGYKKKSEGFETISNWALGGVATQSSSLVGWGAVYGDISAKMAITPGAKFSHTGWQLNPWWEVDLLRNINITRIHIKNRTDCCMNSIVPFVIIIYNADNNVVKYSEIFNEQNQSDYEWSLSPPVVGKRVRIQVNNTTYLHMQAVDVFGSLYIDKTAFCPDPYYAEFNPSGCWTADSALSCRNSVKNTYMSDNTLCKNKYTLESYDLYNFINTIDKIAKNKSCYECGEWRSLMRELKTVVCNANKLWGSETQCQFITDNDIIQMLYKTHQMCNNPNNKTEYNCIKRAKILDKLRNLGRVIKFKFSNVCSCNTNDEPCSPC